MGRLCMQFLKIGMQTQRKNKKEKYTALHSLYATLNYFYSFICLIILILVGEGQAFSFFFFIVPHLKWNKVGSNSQEK